MPDIEEMLGWLKKNLSFSFDFQLDIDITEEEIWADLQEGQDNQRGPTPLQQKETYYKRLKQLRPAITDVTKAIEKKAYDPLDKHVSKFTTAKSETIKAQNEEDFGKALGKLDELEQAIKQIQAARLATFKDKIEDADDADKIWAVIDKMEMNEIVALGQAQQLTFVKTLRGNGKEVCNLCGIDWPTDKTVVDCPKVGGCLGIKTNEVKSGTNGDKARLKIFQAMNLQPEFIKHDKLLRKNAVDIFTAGEGKEAYENARTNWATWGEDERFKFIREAAGLQCKVFGHDTPSIEIDRTLQPMKCASSTFRCTAIQFGCDTPTCDNCVNNLGFWGYTTVAPKCDLCNQPGDVFWTCSNTSTWVAVSAKCPTCKRPSDDGTSCEAVWPRSTTDGVCDVCGGKGTTGQNFGCCDFSLLKDKPKSIIHLNASDNVIGNFEETFNTIMHENSHNYQIYLVKEYNKDKEALFKKHPEAKAFELQIQMWDENVLGYTLDDDTYAVQPTEIHAWKVGNKIQTGVAQNRLGLKPPRKFGSIKNEAEKKLK